MASKRSIGGLKVSVAAPFKFVKKSSRFNRCIGSKLRGSKGGNIQAKFAEAAKECRGK